MKSKKEYKCSDCSHTSKRFFALCPKCKEGFGEETTVKDIVLKGSSSNKSNTQPLEKSTLVSIKDIDLNQTKRINTNLKQLNNIFGGDEKSPGIALHSINLLSGEPGVGKSTLLLQLLENIQKNNYKSIYFSAEENEEQIKDRYERLNLKEDFIVKNENNILQILKDSEDFDFIIIDSINTMFIEGLGVIGGISQIKEATMLLMNYAKQENKTIILVGQVSKNGDIAGPNTLKHMVDGVFFFEDFDDSKKYKILTSQKNRFGKVNESVILEMGELGLSEIVDPSLMFVDESEDTFGTALSLFLKGNRPIFIEIESLVNDTNSEKNIIQSVGIDQKKLFQLTAILSKYMNFSSFQKNIFTNVVGGFNLVKENNPHLDLSIIASILSSENQVNISKYLFIGEVSLSGKIRKSSRETELLKYCKDIGIDKEIISNTTGYNHISDILKLF